MKKACALSYQLNAQRRHKSDWADAQPDLSLRRAHTHFVVFVISRLVYVGFRVIGSLFGASLVVAATAYDVIVIQWLMAEGRDTSGYQVICLMIHVNIKIYDTYLVTHFCMDKLYQVL